MALTSSFGTGGIVLFMQGVFFLLLLIFTIYSSFLIYHWFRYGARRETSVRATTTYLGVGVACFCIMGVVLLAMR